MVNRVKTLDTKMKMNYIFQEVECKTKHHKRQNVLSVCVVHVGMEVAALSLNMDVKLFSVF